MSMTRWNVGFFSNRPRSSNHLKTSLGFYSTPLPWRLKKPPFIGPTLDAYPKIPSSSFLFALPLWTCAPNSLMSYACSQLSYHLSCHTKTFEHPSFFSGGKLISLAALNTSLTLPFWTYTQIKHFLCSQGLPATWTRLLTPPKTLCGRKQPQRHIILTLYSSSFGDLSAQQSSSSITWEWDLGISLSPEEWEPMCILIYKGSLNVAS